MSWLWARRAREPDTAAEAAAEAAEEQAAELERRAAVAEEALREYLRTRLDRFDPWSASVLTTIHVRGRHGR